MDTKILQQSYF